LQHVAYCINKENENQRSYKDKFVRFNVSDNLRGNNFEQKTIGGRLAEKPQENKIIPAGYKEVNQSDYFDHLVPRMNRQALPQKIAKKPTLIADETRALSPEQKPKLESVDYGSLTPLKVGDSPKGSKVEPSHYEYGDPSPLPPNTKDPVAGLSTRRHSQGTYLSQANLKTLQASGANGSGMVMERMQESKTPQRKPADLARN
jgi:hypothetical protein